MIITVIVVCEIAFWVAIISGLALRYLARMPRAGLLVLALVPLIDLVLLIATAVNLRSGESATVAHSLAAFYLGFSIAYGHRMIRWADIRFAHRYADGPRPEKPHGAAYARLCWADVGRTALAVAIASGITWLLVAWIADPGRTAALETTYRWSGLVLAIEIAWAVSYTLWPRKPQVAYDGSPSAR